MKEEGIDILKLEKEIPLMKKELEQHRQLKDNAFKEKDDTNFYKHRDKIRELRKQIKKAKKQIQLKRKFNKKRKGDSDVV